MGATQPLWDYAVDLDIIFAVAQQRDFALTFLDCCREQKKKIAVGPTVIQELNFAVTKRTDWAKKTAEKALKELRTWCSFFDMQPFGHGMTEQFALDLINRNMIPEDQLNAGLILAEVAFAQIPILLTGSSALLSIDRDQLQERCDHFDHPLCVQIEWPPNLLAKWGRTFVH